MKRGKNETMKNESEEPPSKKTVASLKTIGCECYGDEKKQFTIYEYIHLHSLCSNKKSS